MDTAAGASGSKLFGSGGMGEEVVWVKGEFLIRMHLPTQPLPNTHLTLGRPGSLPGGKVSLPGARSGAADE